MIEGFTKTVIRCNGVDLAVHRAGQGQPLLLIHGFPQNHMCWESVAPQLARRHDVIIPDLRGYGESSAPTNDPSNTTYSKRTMAQDMADLLTALDISRADVLGHDRGARVAYRFALDHPERLGKLGIIEIVPTADFWASWTADLAMAAYHWTFLAQPAPLPERMIGADPVAYVEWTLAQWTLTKSLEAFPPPLWTVTARRPLIPHGFMPCAQIIAPEPALTAPWMRPIKPLENRSPHHCACSMAPMGFRPKAAMPPKSGAAGPLRWRPAFVRPGISSWRKIQGLFLRPLSPSLRRRKSPSLLPKTSLYAAIAQILCEVLSGASTGLAGRHPGLRHNP